MLHRTSCGHRGNSSGYNLTDRRNTRAQEQVKSSSLTKCGERSHHAGAPQLLQWHQIEPRDSARPLSQRLRSYQSKHDGHRLALHLALKQPASCSEQPQPESFLIPWRHAALSSCVPCRRRAYVEFPRTCLSFYGVQSPEIHGYGLRQGAVIGSFVRLED